MYLKFKDAEKGGTFLGTFILKNYLCKVVFRKHTFYGLYRQEEGIRPLGNGLKGLQWQVTCCLWAQTSLTICQSDYSSTVSLWQGIKKSDYLHRPPLQIFNRYQSISGKKIVFRIT